MVTTTTGAHGEHGLRYVLDKAGVENMSDMAAIREEQKLIRMMQRDAEQDWLRIRSEAGHVTYNDKRAMSWLMIVVDQLYRTEEWRDIIAAVRVVAKDPRSSPWAVRDMCYRMAAERRDREHAARMMAEREQGYGTGV